MVSGDGSRKRERRDDGNANVEPELFAAVVAKFPRRRVGILRRLDAKREGIAAATVEGVHRWNEVAADADADVRIVEADIDAIIVIASASVSAATVRPRYTMNPTGGLPEIEFLTLERFCFAIIGLETS